MFKELVNVPPNQLNTNLMTFDEWFCQKHFLKNDLSPFNQEPVYSKISSTAKILKKYFPYSPSTILFNTNNKKSPRNQNINKSLLRTERDRNTFFFGNICNRFYVCQIRFVSGCSVFKPKSDTFNRTNHK